MLTYLYGGDEHAFVSTGLARQVPYQYEQHLANGPPVRDMTSENHNAWDGRSTHLNWSGPDERYILHSTGRVIRKLEKRLVKKRIEDRKVGQTHS